MQSNNQGRDADAREVPARGAAIGLAGMVGTVAAAILLVQVPREESGRTVAVEMRPDGQPSIRHVAGPQYLNAYLDAAGVPTACDGITKGVRIGQRYSEAQCSAMLESALSDHARGVQRCVPTLWADGRDWQRAAAVSLAYNIGVGAFCSSTAARRFRAGQWAAGCDAFLLWDKATIRGRKIVLRGLALRRARERQICRTSLVAGSTPDNWRERVETIR